MLLEGGQAADNLVSDLITVTGNKKLKYVRATVTDNFQQQQQQQSDPFSIPFPWCIC